MVKTNTENIRARLLFLTKRLKYVIVWYKSNIFKSSVLFLEQKNEKMFLKN